MFIKNNFIFNIPAELKHKSGIYRISQNIDTKIYVGSADNFGGRFHRHTNRLKKDKHENRYLQNFYNKYSEATFTLELVELVEDLSLLLDREQFWLDETKCYERDKGFNICMKARSSLGVKRTEEFKANLRGKNNPMFGKKHTPERIRKISEAMTGIKRTEEFCLKFRGEKNPFFGKKHSTEILERLSKASIGNDNWKLRKPYSEESKKRMGESQKNSIIQTTKTGEFIKEFSSLIQAAQELGLPNSAGISAACRGKQKTVKGYYFQYKSDYLLQNKETVLDYSPPISFPLL